jgi:hypothetical protein
MNEGCTREVFRRIGGGITMGMGDNSIIVYRSPIERDFYEGIYYIGSTYPYHLIGVLVGFITLCIFVSWWHDVGSRMVKKWWRGEK